MTRKTDADPDFHLYRPNVGVIVYDRKGRVWIGRRIGTPDPYNWQFPQGGVDDGEDFEAAARRELCEETGIRSVRLLGGTDGWIAYDFPPEVLNGPMKRRGFKGQRQRWFAYRFDGEEAEIDLNAHPPAEFDLWRWTDLDTVAALVVPFKREAYREVLAFARTWAEPG